MDLSLESIRDAIKRHVFNGLKESLWEEIGGNDLLITFWKKLVQDGEEALFWCSPNSMEKNKLNDLKENTNGYDFDAWIAMHEKGLLPLCKNPMLLKMVCDLYINSGSDLPKNRGKLFEQFAERCICSEINRLKKIGEKSTDDLNKLKENTYTFLTLLAETIIVNQQGTGINYTNGHSFLKMYFEDEYIEEIEKFARDAGVLISDEVEYRFIHQLHQEYFASRSLQKAFTNNENPTKFFNKEIWWEPTGWEEPSVILAGILTNNELEKFLLWVSDVQPKLVIRCIKNAGISGFSVNSIKPETRISLLQKWLNRIQQESDGSKSRIYIGQAIDKLGDPRDGVGVVKVNGINIPEIEWIEYNNGVFISKYPITVRQYNAFLEDEDGYHNDAYWFTTCESQEWHRNRKAIPKLPRLNNAPMVNVSWYDAVAFCIWLSKKTNEQIRLPYEEEWTICMNSKSNSINSISELDLQEMDDSDKHASVGLFATGDTRKKVLDVGLIWEWCNDTFGDKPNLWGGVNPDSNPTRILKGGSWRFPLGNNWNSYQFRTYASHMSIDIGFRVVKIIQNN